MEDTSEENKKIIAFILDGKSYGERFQMTIDMFQTFKTFVRSSILNENPELSEIDLRIETFKRMYKNDFSEKEMQNICSSFR